MPNPDARTNGTSAKDAWLASTLLPALFEEVDSGRRLTVLDIGAGNAATVQFFSRFHCRVHFADLFGETGVVTQRQDRRTAKQLFFQRVFDFPHDTVFDVCLFWDFLNYLNKPLLRDFANTLRQHVHHATRGHAFVPFSNALPFTGLRFGLGDMHRLIVRRDPGVVPHPHTRKEITQTFSPFRVSRAALLAENRQELLFEVWRL